MRRSRQRRTRAVALAAGAVCATGAVLSAVWTVSRGRGGSSSGGGRAAAEKPAGGQRTLTVIGYGSVSVPPDEALVALGIRVTAASAREASAQGNAALQRILAVVKEQGIAEGEIHITRLDIAPEYHHEERGPLPVRYTVTSAVHVTVADLAKVSELLDAAIEAGEGDVLVQDVSLLTRDTRGAEARSRSAAFAHAWEKAQQLARDAGVTLGEVQSIAEELGGLPMGPRRARMPASYFDATAVPTGETEVSATLEVVWALA